MNDTFFKKAKESIQNISMTSSEKKMVLKRVMNSVSTKTAPVKSTWTIFSFSSFVSSHRFASAFAVILIIGLGGNSILAASKSAVPGDSLYSLKVNVAEPMRLAFAPNFVAKAEVQSDLVQARFEEAEQLAVAGNLDESKEKEISARVTQQVSDLNANIEQIKKVSTEKADEVTDTAQASVRAHARLLNDISVGRGEKKTKLSDTTREASVALGDQPQFVAMTRMADEAPIKKSAPMKKAASTSAASSVPYSATGATPSTPSFVPVATSLSVTAPADSGISASVTSTTSNEVITETISDQVTQEVSIPAPAARMSFQADLSAANSTTTDREVRRQIKEEEIFQKAKEKLEKRGRKGGF